jgi:hypothetical protein
LEPKEVDGHNAASATGAAGAARRGNQRRLTFVCYMYERVQVITIHCHL